LAKIKLRTAKLGGSTGPIYSLSPAGTEFWGSELMPGILPINQPNIALSLWLLNAVCVTGQN